MLSQVHYLVHTILSEGIQPTQEKICAIRDAQAPIDLHQLKSFLGLLNFYAKFLPNLSTVLAPLYSLLQKNRPCMVVGSRATTSSSASETTTHLNSYMYKVVLAADASPYGVGAALSHQMPVVTEQPAAYASRSL